MKPFSRNSRATGPKMRVPFGFWPSVSRITAALSSKRMVEPSSRRHSFAQRTITALTISLFLIRTLRRGRFYCADHNITNSPVAAGGAAHDVDHKDLAGAWCYQQLLTGTRAGSCRFSFNLFGFFGFSFFSDHGFLGSLDHFNDISASSTRLTGIAFSPWLVRIFSTTQRL